MIGPLLSRLLAPQTLAAATARAVFDRLVDPARDETERVALLVALASRAPSAEELTRFAREMRRRARPFRYPQGDRPVDLCGSGGAPRPSYNVSTVSAFVVAAGGVPVVKHGNRSARGPCGSSDLLEALGLPVTSLPGFATATYRAARLAFLHAPLYHPATAAVRDARAAIGIPTLFNHLGPLSSPAAVPFQVVGAPDVEHAQLFARSLAALGVRRGLAMSSREGCDEFSPHRPTTVILWDRGRSSRLTIAPERWLEPSERRGPWGPLSPTAAAREAERLLGGGPGARRGSVLLTSGAGLWAGGAATDLSDGVRLAREHLDDGTALELLGRLRRLAPQPQRSDG